MQQSSDWKAKCTHGLTDIRKVFPIWRLAQISVFMFFLFFGQVELTLSMTVARCCVHDSDWKSSMQSREDTEWGSMCWMVLGDVAIPKMNVSGRRSMY